jgi:hypothetical protein
MPNGRVESLPVYRVFGTKYTNYYTIIEAADQFEAVDLANALPETEWNSIPTDDVIEATDVYLNEDTSDELQLNI